MARLGSHRSLRPIGRALLVALLILACTDRDATAPVAPHDDAAPSPLPTAVEDTASPATLVGAGDIAVCNTPFDELTADLVDRIPGTVFTIGDNAYANGTVAEYERCYRASWGRHLARTRPAPGDRDYRTPGANGYFSYFGAAAGDPARGYYSYLRGGWRIVVLNSNIGRDSASAQLQWLRAELSAAREQCTAAIWHHPRFTSTLLRSTNNSVRPIWEVLHEFGADLVLNAHDRVYERFAPMRPDGTRDSEFGIRQFTVGTGGAAFDLFGAPHPNSDSRQALAHGVLRLTLEPGRYQWEFVPVLGQAFSDRGTGSCHGRPGGDPPVEEVLVGAGNIASCAQLAFPRAQATATLLDSIPGTVFAAGDNAFPNGSDSAYANCYAPTWGRHRARTWAALGNHEYGLGNADGSFNYFGERAGPRGLGYYSFDLGRWHVVVLNDNRQYVSISAGSPQDQWLQADLAATTQPCIAAIWHTPLNLSSNSSGFTRNESRRILWDRLYAVGADLVLNAQQHHYERMAPMRPDGTPDAALGIRQFNIGTGGESTELPTVAIHPSSEVRSAAFGVLKLTLRADGYSWEFVPVPGSSFTDTGSGQCH